MSKKKKLLKIQAKEIKINNKLDELFEEKDFVYFDFYSELNEIINFVINNLHFKNCNYTNEALRSKIRDHGKRVSKNVDEIIIYLSEIKLIKLSNIEKQNLKIASLLHDIGKIYKDDNHEIYSAIISKYLMNMDYKMRKDSIFNEARINEIINIILNHSHKKKKRNEINICSKILRDADLFDENCGHSLVSLLASVIKNNSKKVDKKGNKIYNLNHLIYDESDRYLNEVQTYHHLCDIYDRINIYENIFLFNKMLKEAISIYDEMTFNHKYEYKKNGGIIDDDKYIIRID